MAADSVTVSPTFNGDSVSLTAGMIVRLKPGADNNVVRAKADTAPNIQGMSGVVVSGAAAPTTAVLIACTGRETVQMESGLTLAVGDTVYVSPNVAGKGTNVLPTNVAAVGTVADVSEYARLGTAEVLVNVGGVTTPIDFGAAPPVVLATKSVAGTATTAARSDHDHGQYMVAQWPQANPRIYAVDGVNGNDANDGFADAASASTPDVVAATQAAGLVAKKTLAGLAAIFPRQGSARNCVVVIAAGTYADSIVKVLNGCEGYRTLIVRGTGTNPTAGCTAFDGSPADLVYVGAQIATGTNANGYNPTGGATTSVIPCQLNGGGSATFAAEPAVPLACRLRFDANTATVALRNQTAQIIQVSGSTLTLSNTTKLSTAPATNDVFYIEQPGVVSPISSVEPLALRSLAYHNVSSNYLVGIWITGGTAIPSGDMTLCFFQCAGMGGGSGLPLTIDNSEHLGGVYIYVDGSLPRIGGAGRIDGFTSFDLGANALNFSSFTIYFPGSGVNVLDIQNIYIGDGAVVYGTLHCGGNRPTISSDSITLGALLDLGEKTTRILGSGTKYGLHLDNFAGTVGGFDITGVGAHPAIMLDRQCQITFFNLVSGSTGNSDVGMDLTTTYGSVIVLVTIPTVTGTLGDVRLADGTIISWATAAAGVTDVNGNQIYARGSAPLSPIPVANGGATVTMTNAPAGSPAAPVRYFKLPDGRGGFFTIASLT